MPRPSSCRLVPAGLSLGLVLAVAGCGTGAAPERVGAAAPGGGPGGTAATSRAPDEPRVTDGFSSVRDVQRQAAPVRLRIPSLGVDAPVGPVGQAPDGTVEVPSRWEDVGWYDGGARPGEDGPAVLLGHVDSKAGPAVFARLPQVPAGAVVEVVGGDGRVTQFRVDRVESYPKTRFPTDAVYLPALRPELRLVTCGGAFDRRTGHYVDNLVAYASLVA